MSWPTLVVGLFIGIVIGRLYGLVKYRYPENREKIALAVSSLRMQRAANELRTERLRSDRLEEIQQREGGVTYE